MAEKKKVQIVIQIVLEQQEKRQRLYSHLEKEFKAFLESGDETTYNKRIAEVTKSFADISAQINLQEKKLQKEEKKEKEEEKEREAGIAIRSLQNLERSKLQNMVQYQIDKKKLNEDEETDFVLQQTIRRHFQARQELIEEINETILELRSLLYEEE